MFNLFKKKSEREKLYDQYKKLLKEAHQLASSNRTASDAKTAEANSILEQIDKLEK